MRMYHGSLLPNISLSLELIWNEISKYPRPEQSKQHTRGSVFSQEKDFSIMLPDSLETTHFSTLPKISHDY